MEAASRAAWRCLLLVFPLAGFGCALGQWLAPETPRVTLDRVPDPLYEEFFPYYAELCAVSQFRAKDGTVGGTPGHAVMYLKGACRDDAAPYPRIGLCEDGPHPMDHPLHGVGVSVNRSFKNVNWMATPGRELFFFGDLTARQTLDIAHRDATLRKALDLGLYRGIELHDDPAEAAAPSLEDFVLHKSLGTDFALHFARTMVCSRVPVTRKMLGEIVDYLNSLNAEYAAGTADYQWNGYNDNCVHTVRNALAAAHVWLAKPPHEIKAFLHLAVPANEVVELAERGGGFPIEDPGALADDEVALASLRENSWLPGRHGAVIETHHPHQRNELYDTTYRELVLEWPFHRSVTDRARRVMDDARFVDLQTNLLFFEDRYAEILDAGPVDPEVLDPAIERAYRAQVEKSLREVRDMLSHLDPHRH